MSEEFARMSNRKAALEELGSRKPTLEVLVHEECAYIHPHVGDFPCKTVVELHRDYMESNYGTRSPICQYCDEPVWMSLQGFYGGGSWTTNPENEGPNFGGNEVDGEAMDCPKSPDGQHDAKSLNPEGPSGLPCMNPSHTHA